MAVSVDKTVQVSPHTDIVYQIDCSAWDVVSLDADTIASGVISWGDANVPGTVGTPTASSPADQFLNVHLTGFADGTTYYMRAKITSTGNAVEDYYIKFVCDEPAGF